MLIPPSALKVGGTIFTTAHTMLPIIRAENGEPSREEARCERVCLPARRLDGKRKRGYYLWSMKTGRHFTWENMRDARERGMKIKVGQSGQIKVCLSPKDIRRKECKLIFCR
jgi:hypothetical protein